MENHKEIEGTGESVESVQCHNRRGTDQGEKPDIVKDLIFSAARFNKEHGKMKFREGDNFKFMLATQAINDVLTENFISTILDKAAASRDAGNFIKALNYLVKHIGNYSVNEDEATKTSLEKFFSNIKKCAFDTYSCRIYVGEDKLLYMRIKYFRKTNSMGIMLSQNFPSEAKEEFDYLRRE
ncbi:hypothetical protein HZA39_02160 [Candidatus Peregrinibacteria bacterium]|nr:hypothetical protein [Candidatus Peregrinibacteria bacterium]